MILCQTSILAILNKSLNVSNACNLPYVNSIVQSQQQLLILIDFIDFEIDFTFDRFYRFCHFGRFLYLCDFLSNAIFGHFSNRVIHAMILTM